MSKIIYFLAIMIRSISALNAPGTIQPRSSSEYGRYSFDVPPSKSEPTNDDCQTNSTTNPSSFAVDYSNCVATRSGNPGTIQYLDLDTFADDFSKAMLSVPALQRFLKRQIPVSETKDLFYKLEYTFLKEIGYSSPEYPAFAIAETLALYDDFPLKMYFKVVGVGIARFLQSNNIAVGRNVIDCYAYFLERAVQPSCVDSDEALYKAFLDTFVNFLSSLGFNFLENADILVQLLARVLFDFSKK